MSKTCNSIFSNILAGTPTSSRNIAFHCLAIGFNTAHSACHFVQIVQFFNKTNELMHKNGDTFI